MGIMGFGLVGRQIYQHSLEHDRFDIVAISDIGRREILHHLLLTTMGRDVDVRLEKNHLISERGRARLMHADHPNEIPWDAFGVDLVVDATGRYHSLTELTPHLENGARRVILSKPPVEAIDRVILSGVNEDAASARDRIVSAGSPTTTATGLALKVITDAYPIEYASMTSVHSYTSDQSLQDYAGPDYRRSRSGAKNIIPNTTPVLECVQQVLPAVKGKLSAYTLNVPVQIGSMLDLTVAFADQGVETEDINTRFIEAAKTRPELVATTNDPIVSSDVKGCSQSLLVDLRGTMKAGERMVKLLAWHETFGHARRILDVADLYANLDARADGVDGVVRPNDDDTQEGQS
jgi:glyceraldehyde 3-phosphate dehydrogenase